MFTRIRSLASRFCRATLRPLFATSPLRRGRGAARGHAGFTLLEIVFAVEVMLLLTIIGYSETWRVREHAKVAACMRYQAVIQRSLWGGFALSGSFPADIAATLAGLPTGVLAKAYKYNPTMALDQYYMRCGHNHSYVGVLFCDSGAYLPPRAIYAMAAARGTL